MLRLTLAVTFIVTVPTAHVSAQTISGIQNSGIQSPHSRSIADDSSRTAPIVRPTVATRGTTPSVTAIGTATSPTARQPFLQEDVTPQLDASAIAPPATEASESSLKFGGWAQTGYHSNSTGLFNDRPDKVNLQQLWFFAEKEVKQEHYWDWGFRFDLMYGTDAAKTQSFGNPSGTWDFENGLDFGAYGWALPQAYAQFGKDQWTIKAGHFYTLVGYEVVTAPDNFFYSHAYTMFNSEPFTHTGAIASYEVNDSLTIHNGWTLGWDTGFNQLNGGSSYLGGFSKSLNDNLTFTYIATAGNFGWRGNGYTHSIVLDNQLTERLNYVFQSDLVSTDTSGGNNNEVGINQYLLYTLTERLRAGTRIEWWKSDISGSTESTYSLTGGFNFTPTERLIVRPEVRYNWGADLVGADMETPIFGIDAIITF